MRQRGCSDTSKCAGTLHFRNALPHPVSREADAIRAGRAAPLH